MAFTFPLMADLLKHRLLALKRAIKNLPADYYVEEQKRRLAKSSSGQKLFVLSSVCHICGFSMAELMLDNNWSIRACSATGFRHIINNPCLNTWEKSVHET